MSDSGTTSQTKIPSNLRVLVVDDMSTMRKIIINTTTKLGITNFKEAENGQQALDLMKSLVGGPEEIQFVFSDINMPVMTGIQFLKAVKADAKLKKVPVMMVSAENEVSFLIEATSSGAEDFLVKPFSPEELEEKILRFLFPNSSRKK